MNPFDRDSARFYKKTDELFGRWMSMWQAKDPCMAPRHPEFTKEMWLLKRADVGLLVPSGLPVYIELPSGERRLGVVLDPVLDGNYTVGSVRVKTSSGVENYEPAHVLRADIPAEVMEFAKAQILEGIKCPLAGGGK